MVANYRLKEIDRKARILERCERDNTTGCWNWTAKCDRGGYGALGVWLRDTRRSVTLRAHRESYEAFIGPIPEGLTLDHLCRNRRCVNPEHLEPVTKAENVLRGESPLAIAARRTHCRNGHLLPEKRRCLVCQAASVARYQARKRVGR